MIPELFGALAAIVMTLMGVEAAARFFRGHR
jgi:hypothetical protein